LAQARGQPVYSKVDNQNYGFLVKRIEYDGSYPSIGIPNSNTANMKIPTKALMNIN